MKWIVVGLGNPGIEYEYTRHNIGRLAVEAFERIHNFGGFVSDSKTKSDVAQGELSKHTVTLMTPNTFMNKSGVAVGAIVKSVKAAERLIVVYDDIDLPFGTIRISFSRGTGGHKGLEDIIRTTKTKDFVRVRIGIAPVTPTGEMKKPKGEKTVHDFVLGEFKKSEAEQLSELFKTTTQAIAAIITDGRVKAMNAFN